MMIRQYLGIHFAQKGCWLEVGPPTLPVQYIRVHLEKCILGWGGGELELGSWEVGELVGVGKLGSWLGRKQLELNSSTLLLSTPSLDYESLR